ncbi:MAG: hypothetical protein ACXVO1_11385 [Tumebacillaceae bacterium]
MGLFSSVLHVKNTDPQAVITALNSAMQELGYDSKQFPFLLEGDVKKRFNRPGTLYAVSPRTGDWVSVIDVGDNPWIFDVAPKLSQQLSTYVLALHLHDDDVFVYQLSHNGNIADEYTSNPQNFEMDTLPKEQIEAQRHDPNKLAPCLPDDVTVEQIADLLQAGWWHAYDNNTLDPSGFAPEDDDEYIEEEERMSEFGALLELAGPGGEYPYTAWRDSEEIAWETFLAVQYEGGSNK